MNERRIRRPSAAMIIACIALFAALSGGAYAALSKNSVTSKQIKNGSVAGKDLKPDTLKGKQIKEAKLAQVPSAATADNATNAARLAGVEAVRVQPFTLTNGQSQQVLQHGAFTLTATCSINEAGDDFARILIATSVDNAAFDGDDGTGDLDIATPAANRSLLESQAPTATLGFLDQESDGAAFAPDGTEILASDAYTGVNLAADPLGTCRFGGMFLVD